MLIAKPEAPQDVQITDFKLVPIGPLTTGSRITWQTPSRQILGPAVVVSVLTDEAGTHWAAVTHNGRRQLVAEQAIVSIGGH